MSLINNISVPANYVDLAGRWYSGQDDLLYAVCSTGCLTTGTTCPIRDYDGREDRDLKWYYSLWLGLSGDVGYARRSAKKALDGYTNVGTLEGEEADEWYELNDDYIGLIEFEGWVDSIIEQIETHYPELEDWSGE